MFYSPKQNKKAVVTASVLLALSVIVLALRNVFTQGGVYISIGVMAFLTGAMFITVRFVITRYTYEITSDSLVITKIVGQRKQTAAALSLKTGRGVCARPTDAKTRQAFAEKFGKTDSRMSFTQNIFAKGFVYVAEFNGRVIEFIIECDEEFAAALSRSVEDVKSYGDGEE